MSSSQVTCANCGAKLKLPASFNKPQAKCPKCGSVIDIAAQREAAEGGASSKAKPAAAKPASARPASARPARARPAAAKPAKAAAEDGGSSKKAGGSRRRAKGGDDGEDGGERRARRGGGGGSRRRAGKGDGEEAKSGSSPALMIGGIVGVLAIAIVGYLMFGTGGGTEPTAEETANKTDTESQTPEATDTEEAGPNVAAADAVASDTDAAKPAEASADTGDGEATEGDDDGMSAAEKAEARKAAGGELTLDTIFKPSVDMSPVEFPSDIDEETRAKVTKLVERSESTSFAGTKALRELTKLGYPSIHAIAERMRTLDYTDAGESEYSFALQRTLTDIFEGINLGFRVPESGSAEISLEDAHWNGKVIRAWIQQVVEKIHSQEDFDKTMEARRKSIKKGD